MDLPPTTTKNFSDPASLASASTDKGDDGKEGESAEAQLDEDLDGIFRFNELYGEIAARA